MKNTVRMSIARFNEVGCKLNCPAENVGILPSVFCYVWNANFRAATNKFSSISCETKKETD